MTNSEVEAIVGGYHGDPFRVLGPHLVKGAKGRKPGWEVGAFLPQAEKVDLIAGSQTVAMKKWHPHGFFNVFLGKDPGAYRFRLTLFDGSQREIDDPYRFPPLLTDFDLHLHGEGTHFESYKTLGAHVTEMRGRARRSLRGMGPERDSRERRR